MCVAGSPPLDGMGLVVPVLARLVSVHVRVNTRPATKCYRRHHPCLAYPTSLCNRIVYTVIILNNAQQYLSKSQADFKTDTFTKLTRVIRYDNKVTMKKLT